MAQKDEFSNLHPIINFIFFLFVLLFSMFFMHPVFLGISFFSSFAYLIYLKGWREVSKKMKSHFLFFCFIVLLNPLFNHQGITILFYLRSGNPVTLESILYGIAAATMFLGVLNWFSCYHRVMTSDKFIYLFARIIPSLSLVFSMTLRFVPRYGHQAQRIVRARECMESVRVRKAPFSKMRRGANVLSILVTWALENAIETADSMKARGYGLPGRTAFSIYRWRTRDRNLFLLILCLSVIVMIGAMSGENTIRYYPSIKVKSVHFGSIGIYFSYVLLCNTALLFDLWEDRKWRSFESTI